MARWIKLSLGSLLVCLVLLVNAMAASPKLHEFFHPDAGQTEHHCAVSLFAHGQVDSASVDLSPTVLGSPVPPAPHPEISIFAPAIENLPAGRGPPVSVSSPV